MRASLLPVVCFLALSSLQFAHADDLVSGSTFNVYLQERDQSQNDTIIVRTSVNLMPGGTTTFSLGTATGTISESHSVLSNGLDDFTFTVTSTSDLFPEIVAGDSYFGAIGVGDTSPLQFETPFDVTAAYLSYGTPGGSYVDDNILPAQPDPFNGAYPNTGEDEGYYPIGGRDTTSIVLQIEGNAIPPATPEPSSLILLGTGVLGVAGAARRRFRKA